MAVLIAAVGVVLAAKDRGPETARVEAADAGSISDMTPIPVEPVEKQAANPASETKPAAPENTDKAPPAGRTEPEPKDAKKPAAPDTAATEQARQAKQPEPPAKAEQAKPVQARLPRMLELGADKCIPCKMMKPIIEELQKEYKGRLQMDFIDVWKNPGAAEKYGINTIPTQIFYDTDGKEFFRHVGFFSKEEILATFEEHGIRL